MNRYKNLKTNRDAKVEIKKRYQFLLKISIVECARTQKRQFVTKKSAIKQTYTVFNYSYNAKLFSI